METLKNKVAIVTGSSRGIGADLARTLAARGAKVVVNYAGNAAAADAVLASIREAGGEAMAVQADISQPGAMAQLFDAAIERYGKVDILLNNAGIMIHKPLADTTDEDFARIVGVNLQSSFAGVREAARRLAEGGRVVNFSSTLTRLNFPGYGIYAATKGAVEQITRYAARELGARRITVNAVLPGPVNTELFHQTNTPERTALVVGSTPLGRLGEVEDIARVVAFLVSDEAAWINGQSLGVNGGLA